MIGSLIWIPDSDHSGKMVGEAEKLFRRLLENSRSLIRWRKLDMGGLVEAIRIPRCWGWVQAMLRYKVWG
jgi:hypothetical protein